MIEGIDSNPKRLRTKTLVLTNEEATELKYCIYCRIGIIETGEPMLRATDVALINKSINKDDPFGEKPKNINALTSDQMRLIISLEDIIRKLEEV